MDSGACPAAGVQAARSPIPGGGPLGELALPPSMEPRGRIAGFSAQEAIGRSTDGLEQLHCRLPPAIRPPAGHQWQLTSKCDSGLCGMANVLICLHFGPQSVMLGAIGNAQNGWHASTSPRLSMRGDVAGRSSGLPDNTIGQRKSACCVDRSGLGVGSAPRDIAV